jgi:hypothetical protein
MLRSGARRDGQQITRHADELAMPDAARDDARGSRAQLDDPFPVRLLQDDADRAREEKEDLLARRMRLPRRRSSVMWKTPTSRRPA